MRKRIFEDGYPASQSTYNQNSALNNFGFEYAVLPLQTNLSQKGNTKPEFETTYTTFVVGDCVSGIAKEDGKEHIGLITALHYNDNAHPIIADVMDSKDRKVYHLKYDTLDNETDIYEMRNERLSDRIINGIGKELKAALTEGVRSNGGVRQPLDMQRQVTNVDMEQPIFQNPRYANWYQNFVCLGGGCFIKKRNGMDSHTFICNTAESARSLYSMMMQDFVKRHIYAEGDMQYNEIMKLI